MLAESIVAIALLATRIAAQGTLANSTLDPTTIDNTTKAGWCASEVNVCGNLCSGNYTANTCDASTLDYTCLCSNGSAPGLQYYTGSLDTFICDQIYSNCLVAQANNPAGQNVCKANADANCGVIVPQNVTVISTSTSTAASTVPSSTASTTSAVTSPPSSPAAQHGGLTTGAKAGVGIGAALGAILVAGVAYFFYRSAQRKKSEQSSHIEPDVSELGGGKPKGAELSDGKPLTRDEMMELERRRAAELDSAPVGELHGDDRTELEARRRQRRDLFELH